VAQRTQAFQVFPWAGGLDRSNDPALVAPSDFTTLQNVDISVRNTKVTRDGINFNWDSASTSTDPIRSLTDYWYESSGSKERRIVEIFESGSVSAITTSTTFTDISDTTNPWSDVTRATAVVFGNFIIMGAEGPGNQIKIWDGSSSTVTNLTSYNLFDSADEDPPEGWILQRHLGRVWSNDKNRPDRLHYTTSNNVFEWGGTGDSGAIDVGLGDGDPEGITAIFPPFKGQLFVAKRTKLYRITGTTPENFAVELVSDSIGCVSPQAVDQVDTDDIYWVSDRGVHSLLATDAFGDFQSQFVSSAIQQDFNTRVNHSRLENIQARYLPTINSVAFAISPTGSTVNSELWLYHTGFKYWYYWTNIDAESIERVQDLDKIRFYLGTSTGRVAQALAGQTSDTSTAGADVAIDMRLISGNNFPDNTPMTTKAFKTAAIIYRPSTSHSLTLNFQTDFQEQQSETFTVPTSVATLGSTFILGTSPLGQTGIVAPYYFTIDGVGRSFAVDIRNNGVEEKVEVLGYSIEWEPAGPTREVRNV